MARKRGGLAGIWDRNKHIIKPGATALAGMLTGGAALPALLGGAMGGLDREGKGGIGLDFGGAAKGALSGYGMGKLGQFAKGIPSAVGLTSTPAAASGESIKDQILQKLKGAGSWAKKNPEAIAGGLNAGATMMASGSMADSEGARLDFDRQRYEDEQEERRRRAEIAQQLYAMVMGDMSYNKGGGGGQLR